VAERGHGKYLPPGTFGNRPHTLRIQGRMTLPNPRSAARASGARITFVIAVVAMLQVVTWFAFGRSALRKSVPNVVGRELVFFHRFLAFHWPHTTWPPFEVLVIERRAIPYQVRARLQTILARERITLAAVAPVGLPPGAAQDYSYEIGVNTPLVGAISSSYRAKEAGVSMRTTFLFVFGAWVPVSTKQITVS
jgi:hypothetical protein